MIGRFSWGMTGSARWVAGARPVHTPSISRVARLRMVSTRGGGYCLTAFP